ncbi:hypothetical protein A1O3_03338 [Capronia epimyces CBS 606.96]|uniref:DUF1742-domain-containing protein n=1 Tax=Capronia epimyces CBS 606.96 TaxID=1182542 RepID=W9Y0T0_9EURO|nr:uncharacterized protein A1O3_03338 [Capronia epimyces CBS 606.96]EXJ86387.1 hypothetical protein A1O3_03338 [Capronia epimyces CBS 606.96]
MATPFANVYHLRTVAEASSKACYVCHKPTAKVLITPDNKDFFYICVSHLNDRGFASPIVDQEAEAAKKRKELMDQEIEKIKQEYEEKQRKKKGKEKGKEKKDDDDDSKAEKERDDKVCFWSTDTKLSSSGSDILQIKAVQSGANSDDKADAASAARVYALHRNFYQMRMDRVRKLEQARRNQQRMKDPNLFPAVPKGDIA